MFIARHVNFPNHSPEVETFEEAAAWCKDKGFEATIWDLSQQINFGFLMVGYFSSFSGLRDLRLPECNNA